MRSIVETLVEELKNSKGLDPGQVKAIIHNNLYTEEELKNGDHEGNHSCWMGDRNLVVTLGMSQEVQEIFQDFANHPNVIMQAPSDKQSAAFFVTTVSEWLTLPLAAGHSKTYKTRHWLPVIYHYDPEAREVGWKR